MSNDIEIEVHPSHRFAGCEWEDKVSVAESVEGKHPARARDFVVDEFELYGVGD